MCRLMAYFGDETLLARLLLWPDRSVIRQSYDARERLLDPNLPAHLGHGNLNADGFGIGWYSARSSGEAAPPGALRRSPCTFKSITPAWNNDNLARLAAKICSPLMFAHVRAAYPGMPVSEQNCHPFAYGHYLFMHNGIIAGFSKIRRRLLETLPDAAYDAVQSFHSDSAVSFALFLSFLPNLTDALPAEALVHALQSVFERIAALQAEAGVAQDCSLLNFVVTDGSTLIATRFVSPDSANPASLYYAEGTSFRRADGTDEAGEAEYSLEYADKSARLVMVTSEPITGAASDWVVVPRNHALVVTRDPNGWMNVLHTPICSAAPSPRLEVMLRCLKSLPLDAKHHMGAPAGKPKMLDRLVHGIEGRGAESNVHMCPLCGGNQFVNFQQQVLDILDAHYEPRGSNGSSGDARRRSARPTRSLLTESLGGGDVGGGTERRSSDGSVAADSVPTGAPTALAPPLPMRLAGAAEGMTQISESASPDLLRPVSAAEVLHRRAPSAAEALGMHHTGSWHAGSAMSTTLSGALDECVAVAEAERLGDALHAFRSPGLRVSSAASNRAPHSGALAARGEAGLWQGPLPAPHLLTGHDCAILHMTPGSNGCLYTSSADKSIKVWDLNELACTATLQGHSKPILKIQQQGQFLFSVGGSSVRVWDTTTGACQARILTSRSAGTLRSLCVMPDMRIVVGCQDTCIKLYNFTPPAAGRWTLPSSLNQRGFEAVTAGGSGQQNGAVARSGAGGAATPSLTSPSRATVHEADARTSSGSLGWSPRAFGPAPPYVQAAFGAAPANAPDADPLDAALFASFVQQHSGDKDRLAAYVVEPALTGDVDEGHCAAVQSVVHSRKHIISAGGDCLIRVWRAEDLSHVCALTGHRGPVFALIVVGELLLSGGRDGSIRVWDLEALCCRRTLSGHSADILHLAASAAGLSLNVDGPPPPHGAGTSDEDGSGSPTDTAAADADGAGGVADGPLLFASCSADGTCRLWDMRAWCCLYIFRPIPGPKPKAVLCVSILENAVAIGMGSGHLFVYNIEPLIDALTRGSCRRSVARTAPCNVLSDATSDATTQQASDADDGTDKAALLATPARPRLSRGVTWRRPYQLQRTAECRADSQLLRCFAQFVAIPTVSGDPELHEECFRGAKYLAGLLEGMGMQTKLAAADNTVHPCVLARLEVSPDLPTLVFYGHYDVQPAQELDWTTDPFKVMSKDGYLYGRGTSDNKGPILAMVFAVKELLDQREGEAHGGLSANLTFVFEGEEEIGSQSLSAVVQEHLHWFPQPQLIVISNSQWIGDRVPCLTYGMRGMICLTLRVEGGGRELHSGNDGGVFNEPMADLCRLLGTLVDSQHNILVPGFYDDVDPSLLEPTLQSFQARGGGAVDFDVQEYMASLGVPALTTGGSAEEVLTARWCTPSLSIIDVSSSSTNQTRTRFGPTRFSVIPKFAQANLSVRYVPNQKADDLIGHLQRHLQHEFRKLRSSNRIDFTVKSRGQHWSADPGGCLFKQVSAAIEAEWGQAPLPVREGGTMPCASMLESMLGAPAIMVPMGQFSDNCHLANERLRRQNLIKGKNVMRRIVEGVPDGRCREGGAEGERVHAVASDNANTPVR